MPFVRSVLILTDGNSGNDGESFRSLIKGLINAGGKVQVGFQAPGAGTCKVDHASVGVWNGTASQTKSIAPVHSAPTRKSLATTAQAVSTRRRTSRADRLISTVGEPAH